jgi:hypothetical protein
MRYNKKMMTATAFLISAFATSSVAGFAHANPMLDGEDYANKEMNAGDWSAAEAALLDADVAPEEAVFTKLNLAFVYSTTGRKDMAETLYKEILAAKANPYALTVSGQPRRVKTIAKVALARLSDGQ